MDCDRSIRNSRDSIRDATPFSSSTLRKGKEKWRGGGKKGCDDNISEREKNYSNRFSNNSTFREVFFFFFYSKKERERNIRTRDESDDETDHHVPEKVNFTTRPVIVDFRHDVLIQ